MAINIRSLQHVLVPSPPSDLTGAFASWAWSVTDALNTLPPISVFSFGNPNSNVSAIPGTLGLNLNSANTSKVWVKAIGSGSTGWQSAATI